MTFKIYRDSERNVKPCQNAYPIEVEREILDFDFDENGEFVWNVKKKKEMVWSVEINTLEELMELQKEVQVELTIFGNEIEIHD